MYLTEFQFNPARPQASRLLSSPQVLHAAILASFPDPPRSGDNSPRVLWRLDRNSPTRVTLYITSPARPDLTHLVEQAGWPTTSGWQTYDYQPFLDQLALNDIWSFRLTANPVHNTRRTPTEPTKPTAHLTPHHQKLWLLQRQTGAGFEVLAAPTTPDTATATDHLSLRIRNRQKLHFEKTGCSIGVQRRITLYTATFEGELRVTDPDALRRTLTIGLGRAKAYGCGLMTLAPSVCA
ncbi:type I-E CRISPR-associated protein Cas6/Cse3/CasE [Nocardiopsis suaedae]|uniref:Type I-E CRISPR-associated protein Cas6/Cse3/CasE n=1 Tax=Nocardiopsis suaedae TaxID=3018444 RepID=A0ABT4TR28_9ACTN|nr:type I-E CRISPR-associated protein Cas6/Cse3/CasE [Nocardiopsis suaedae]MDA2807145.1 type I-E CRISPR-associated protein Cas6/Cse3/CasE [Nocardiopsis suaedae]